MKTMSKLLALIVAVAMVLSLLPTAVFAVEESAADASAAVSQEENERQQEEAPEETDGQASNDAPKAEEENPSDDAPEAEEKSSGKVQAQDTTLAEAINAAAADSTITLPEGQMWVEKTAGTYEIASAAAKIGDTNYATLEEAIAAADGKTVKLLRNVALSTGVNISGTVTLDLNGKTISDASNLTGDYLLAVLHGGALTVKDTDSGGKVSMSKEYCAIKMTKANDGDSTKNATLIVDSGIIEGKDFAISGNGNAGRGNSYITINGGTIRNTKSTGSGDDAAIYQPNTGTVTLNGGTITGLTGVEIRSGSLVIPANSTVTVTATGNSATYQGNSNGTTTFGAAIAIAQHTTDNPINVNIAGGSFSGANALAVVNPNNRTGNNVTVLVSGGTFNGAIEKSDARVSKFISGGFFSSDPSAYLADSCQAQNSSGSWTVEQPLHTFNYSKPDVRWRVINGEMKAIFIYSCSYCDETQTEIVTPTSSDSGTTRTYTATDAHGNTKTLEKETGYTVTVPEGVNQSKTGTYAWGEKCTLTAGSAKAWYIGSVSNDNLVADGTNTYIFAVTDTVTIVTGDPIQSTPQAVVRATLKNVQNESGQATFNAKWSIPTGTSVDSVTIYRGFTETDSSNITTDVLKSKGQPHNVNLLVWNGDYTLHLTDLTKKYQYAMIEIVYTDSSGLRQTLRSAVKKIAVTGVSS